MHLKLAICSESPHTSERDLYRLSLVVHAYGQITTPVWNPGGSIDVKAIEHRRRCPLGWKMLLIIDGDHESYGVLGSHTPMSLALPTVGRAHPDRASGFASGKNSLVETVTHEAVEIEADSELDWWVEVPGTQGAETPVEPADGSQETFGFKVGGDVYQVANFMYPAWFGLPNPPGVHGFDAAGRVKEPFEMEASGYRVMRRRATGEQWLDLANGKRLGLDDLPASKKNALSRTHHLLKGNA